MRPRAGLTVYALKVLHHVRRTVQRTHSIQRRHVAVTLLGGHAVSGFPHADHHGVSAQHSTAGRFETCFNDRVLIALAGVAKSTCHHEVDPTVIHRVVSRQNKRQRLFVRSCVARPLELKRGEPNIPAYRTGIIRQADNDLSG